MGEFCSEIMTRLLRFMSWGLCGWVMASHAESHTVLLGTFTRDKSEGIYAVQMDEDTGALAEAKLVARLPDPEFLALHPNGRVVYSLTREKDEWGREVGAVVAFRVDPASGALTEIIRVAVGRGTFAHIAVDPAGRALFVASYDGGYITSWALDETGRLEGDGVLVKLDGPTGPNPGRQNAGHPHSVTVSADGGFAFVADLGLDRVFAFRLSGDVASLDPHVVGDAVISPGSGPRHSTFSPDGRSFYVLNELDGSITVFAYDATAGTLGQIQHLSILPEGYSGRISSSEIRAHPNGRFVYAAHRGDNTLVSFARDEDTGKLTRLGAIHSGGRNPRNFALSPDGKWLLCANQDSHRLASFGVDAVTGALTPTGLSFEVPRAVCVLFVP